MAVSVVSLVSTLYVSACLYLWGMHLSFLLVELAKSSAWDCFPGSLSTWVSKLPSCALVDWWEETLGFQLLEARTVYNIPEHTQSQKPLL